MSLFEPYSKGPQQPAGPGRPNWQAMADAHEAAARRKRMFAIGGAVLGALVVIGGAFALIGNGGGGGDRRASSVDAPQGTGPNGGGTTADPGPGQISPAPGASATGAPGAPGAAGTGGTPSGAASPNPAGGSASASASGAASAAAGLRPLNAGAVLYAQQLSVGNRVYKRMLTDEKSPCWMATTGHLGDALAPNSCAQMLRATWVSGDRAVSVGVAVLPSDADAEAANAAYVGHIEPLHGGPAPGFCPDRSPCALAHGVVGHFTYYVIAGPVGTAPGVDDPASRAAAARLAAFAVQALSRQA